MTIRIKKHIFAVSALAVLSVVTILITSTASVALAPPVADSQPVTTAEGTPGAITLTGSDVNTGDTLSFIIVSLPGSGDLSENGTGITAGDHVLTGDTVTYTPDTNYSGSDSFTFKINDGTSDGDVATITITVTPINDLPVADDRPATVVEDTPVAITLTGSDVDPGDTLSFIIVSLPGNGDLSQGGTGITAGDHVLTGDTVTYTPDTNYSGGDSFTFKVNDGIGDSSVATITITVTPTNDLPAADDQPVTTAEDTPVAITLTGSDVDPGNTLSFVITSVPGSGDLSENGTGITAGDHVLAGDKVTYTPDTNYSGGDSFTFKINDSTGNSDVAAVTITVTPLNDAPVATADARSTVEGVPVTIDVLANDRDAEDDPLTAAPTSLPANGTLTLNPSGSFTYTPNLNFVGEDSFTYEARDDSGLRSSEATVTITVVAPERHLETSLVEALDDGIAVLEIRVDRVVDTETDTTIILDGGIGSYVATLQFDSSCMTISASNQRGGGPFEPPVGLVRGNKLFLSQVNQSTTEQPAPVTVAKVVVQLTGSVNTSCDITLTDLRISDNPAQGLPVPVEQPGASSPEKSLIRGDANGDGTVDENDALFIAGLAVGLRAPGEEVGQVRPVQAAGVNPDGPGGDIPNSVDLLQILQYVVGVRDEFFNLI